VRGIGIGIGGGCLSTTLGFSIWMIRMCAREIGMGIGGGRATLGNGDRLFVVSISHGRAVKPGGGMMMDLSL